MTIPEFQKCKREKKKLLVLTAYDALFTRIVEQAGIETILVGDSLGVVVQGKPNTVSVTMDDMVYHTNWWPAPLSMLWLSETCRFCRTKSIVMTPSAMLAAYFRRGLQRLNWRAVRSSWIVLQP